MCAQSTFYDLPETTLRVLWVEDMLDTMLLGDILEDSEIEKFDLTHAENLGDGLKHLSQKSFPFYRTSVHQPLQGRRP